MGNQQVSKATNGRPESNPATSLRRIQKGSTKLLIISLILFFNFSNSLAQDTTGIQSRKRFSTLAVTAASSYVLINTGLYLAWYQDQATEPFRFYNDSQQWLKVDKIGHAYSSFHIARGGYQGLRWAGLPQKKAAIYAGISSFLWMLPIEIMDGFSAGYGASWPDIAANATGSLLFISQELLLRKQLFRFKYSFHTTEYAAINPNLLGSNYPEQLLKDYNGQTYWLSFTPTDLGLEPWPDWLALSFGYGAEKMVSGRPLILFDRRYSQAYFSVDLNWSAIWQPKKTSGKVVQFILQGIKLPAPSLELSQNKLKFHAVYF